ncbi:MAG: hypothetical protein KKH64_00390, partial [Candidatus Margulisbacteria bacterium]|nr:hypothetical protein [Candidatus Margulisiibacteriota bacterium]
MSLLIARALYQSGRNYVSNQIERGERKVAEVIADGKEVLAEVLDAGKEIVADGFRADGPAAHLEGRAVLLGCDQVEVEEPTCEDLEGFETCLSHEEWFRNDRPETDVNEVVTVSVPKGMINDADVWEYIVPQAFPGASLDEAEVAKFADTLRDTQRAVNPQDGKGLPIENMYVEDNSAYWGLKGRAAHPRFSINVPSALAMATDVNSLEIAKNACETWIDKLAPRKDDERISAAYEKLLERFEI